MSLNIVRSVLAKTVLLTRAAAFQTKVSKQNMLGQLYNGSRALHTSFPAQEKIIVPVPPLAESITEGDVSDVLKEVGAAVGQDEVVLVLETDKIDIEVTSPQAGVITAILTEAGETVEIGQKLFEIDTEGVASVESSAAAPKAEAPTSTPPPAATKPAPQPKTAAAAPSSSPSKGVAIEYGETRVKMNRMRMKIAERLKESQNVAAALTTFNEVDMSNITALRNKHKDKFVDKHGVKLGFMSVFLAAAAHALKDQPVLNAVIEGNDIVYRDSIDISVAVASPKGLVTPVLRGVNDYTFVDYERALSEAAGKAKNGQLAMEDLSGGTFTISNGGVFGSLMGTPIINQPQSSILGMHGIFDRPVAVNGKVEIRPMMYVALTYDHRLVDGREAVTFLKKIKEVVEDPSMILLEM